MNYVQFFKKNIPVILLSSLMLGVLTFGTSVVQPKKYEATEKFIVVHKDKRFIDPFLASRASENTALLMKEVIYTLSFYEKVVDSNFYVLDDFGDNPEDILKNWHKSVRVEVVSDTGLLDISILHTDQLQAEHLAHAIGNILIFDGARLLSNTDGVEFHFLDSPRVSSKPVSPNIAQNTLLGIFVGLFGSVVVLVFRYEAGYTEPLTIWGRKGSRAKQDIDITNHSDFVNNAILESLEDLDSDKVDSHLQPKL